MRYCFRAGLATALFAIVLFLLSGCEKEEALYTVGLEAQTDAEAEAGSSTADAAVGTSSSTTDSAAGTSSSMAEAGTSDSTTDSNAGTSGSTVEADEGASASTVEASEAVVLGYIYVCGAVVNPGVYPITEDMRVCDAIRAAGGFAEDADEEWLNQAKTVSDGQKLYVYTVTETDQMKEEGVSAEGMDTAQATDAAEATDATDDGKINLNTATREELMTLPGIGESKADAILQYRNEHGAFSSIDEIQNISGIKSGVFSKIKDLITV